MLTNQERFERKMGKVEGQYSSLATLLGLVRSGRAVTRPELARQSELGRAFVTQRVEEAIALGLLEDGEFGASTGGRMPRTLRVRGATASIVGVVFGVTRMHVMISDLTGNVLASRFVTWDVRHGPRESLTLLTETVRELQEEITPAPPLWAMVVGLPMLVDFGAGRPLLDPAMPEWGHYPLREWLEAQYAVPVWVDTEVNLMAYGEWRNAPTGFGDEVLLLKCGTSLSSGLITHGHVHRGSRNAAGRLGHVAVDRGSERRCTCGKYGCLESIASGWAVALTATEAGTERGSALSRVLEEQGALTIDDVVDAALAQDRFAERLVADAASTIGRSAATLVSFYNPSAVIVGGSMARIPHIFVESVRRAIFLEASAPALDGLIVTDSLAGHLEGGIGAVNLGIDELFSAEQLSRWVDRGSPVGVSATARNLVEATLER